MSRTIIDNGDAGFAESGANWTTTGYGYGGSQRYNGSNSSAQYATWAFTGLTAGNTYRFAMTWYVGGTVSMVAPWQILDASNGNAVIASGTIDESVSPGGVTVGGRPFQFIGGLLTAPAGCTAITIKVTCDGGSGKQVFADATFIQDGTDFYAISSSQAGDWGTGATWVGGVSPASGDAVIINHAVTVTSDRTCGDGTASTVLSVGSAGTGSLVITGAKLTIRGNATFGGTYPTDGYNWTTGIGALTINPSGSTQGGIEFDGNSGVAPTCMIGDYVVVTANGTLSGHVYIRTKSGSAGDHAYMTNSANVSNFQTGYWIASYCDFARLGSSSVAGITSWIKYEDGSSGVNNQFTWDHCTIDNCGMCPSLASSPDAKLVISITNCTWTNPLATWCLQVQVTDALTTGTRFIDSCVFDGGPYLVTVRDFTVTDNVFLASINGIDDHPLWASFDGNLILRGTAGDNTSEPVLQGSLTNNYWYSVVGGGVTNFLVSSSGSSTISGNVAEYGGTAASGAWLGTTEEAVAAITYTITDNIAFSSAASDDDGWSGILGLNSKAATSNSVFSISHNTFSCATNSTYGAINLGSSGAAPASTFSLLAANIFINTSTTITGCSILENSLTGGSLLVDSAPAANVKNNCWERFDAVPAGTFVTVAPVVTGATTCTNGTRYYSPMSGSTAPGTNDLASTDPGFVDTARNLAAWSTHKGGDGTVDDALARIQADPTLTKTDLIPWVRAGYVPTNAALNHASYAGDTSWTDANGTTVSGVADIGAMAYQSTGNRRRRLISTGTY